MYFNNLLVLAKVCGKLNVALFFEVAREGIL